MAKQGWYPDPNGEPQYIFFDGKRWRPEMTLPFTGPTPHDLQTHDEDLPPLPTNAMPPGMRGKSAADRTPELEAVPPRLTGLAQESPVRKHPDLSTTPEPRSFKILGIGIAAVLFAAIFAIAAMSGSMSSSSNAGPSAAGSQDEYSLADRCEAIVSGWRGASDGVRVLGSLTGNSQGSIAVDLEGVYPGGEWRCAGEHGSNTPFSVMVYPGGYGELSVSDPPEQIFSR